MVIADRRAPTRALPSPSGAFFVRGARVKSWILEAILGGTREAKAGGVGALSLDERMSRVSDALRARFASKATAVIRIEAEILGPRARPTPRRRAAASGTCSSFARACRKNRNRYGRKCSPRRRRSTKAGRCSSITSSRPARSADRERGRRLHEERPRRDALGRAREGTEAKFPPANFLALAGARRHHRRVRLPEKAPRRAPARQPRPVRPLARRAGRERHGDARGRAVLRRHEDPQSRVDRLGSHARPPAGACSASSHPTPHTRNSRRTLAC
jgi:hypothetical protein